MKGTRLLNMIININDISIVWGSVNNLTTSKEKNGMQKKITAINPGPRK